jgi:hypothetical protein
VGPVTGPAQLRRPWVGRLVHDPNFGWMRWKARSVPAANGGLQAGAAMCGAGGADQDPAAARGAVMGRATSTFGRCWRRWCWGAPTPPPAGGWGG